MITIKSTINTAAGPRRLPRTGPSTIRCFLTPDELARIVRLIERDAEAAERDGHHNAAKTLWWRAAALRRPVA